MQKKRKKMEKFELNWSSKLRDITMKEKTPLSHTVVYFQTLDFETSNPKSEVSKIKFVENYFFLKNYFTSEGTVSHNFCILSTSPHSLLPSKVVC